MELTMNEAKKLAKISKVKGSCNLCLKKHHKGKLRSVQYTEYTCDCGLDYYLTSDGLCVMVSDAKDPDDRFYLVQKMTDRQVNAFRRAHTAIHAVPTYNK
jgi:hypothetical protein